MKQGLWERKYQNVDNLWGFNPNGVFIQYLDLIPTGGKVLDVGVGEGRNALFFAKQGYEVEGMDLSETAIKRCIEQSNEHNVTIDAKVNDIRTIEIKNEEYSLIILSSVLNFFNSDDINNILLKLKKGLKKNGLLYINVFDDKEPSLKKIKEKCKKIDEYTYFNEKTSTYHHYFTQKELEILVDDLDTISFTKSNFLDIAHGQPHFHSTLEVLSKEV